MIKATKTIFSTGIERGTYLLERERNGGPLKQTRGTCHYAKIPSASRLGSGNVAAEELSKYELPKAKFQQFLEIEPERKETKIKSINK